jgi:hypothetical protein
MRNLSKEKHATTQTVNSRTPIIETARTVRLRTAGRQRRNSIRYDARRREDGSKRIACRSSPPAPEDFRVNHRTDQAGRPDQRRIVRPPEGDRPAFAGGIRAIASRQPPVRTRHSLVRGRSLGSAAVAGNLDPVARQSAPARFAQTESAPAKLRTSSAESSTESFMIVTAYRITKARFAASIWSGNGARDHGGRWNSKGVSVVYTAQNRSLAALEQLVT